MDEYFKVQENEYTIRTFQMNQEKGFHVLPRLTTVHPTMCVCAKGMCVCAHVCEFGVCAYVPKCGVCMQCASEEF